MLSKVQIELPMMLCLQAQVYLRYPAAEAEDSSVACVGCDTCMQEVEAVPSEMFAWLDCRR